MGQPVVVVAADQPTTDGTAAAFAAGVAAATAAEADQTADAALIQAEAAERVAQAASSEAVAATIESSAAVDLAAHLAARVDRLEAIADDLTDVVIGDQEPVDDPTLPPRVTVDVQTGPNDGDDHADKPDKPKEPKVRTFGHPNWFNRG